MGAGNTESSAVVHINFVVDINSRMQRSIHNYYLYFFKYTCSMSKNIYNKKLWTVTKWHVVDCAQVFCKLLFFGGKTMEFDSSISGLVQVKVCPASFNIVPHFASYTYTIPNFTSVHLVISKLEHVGR